MKVPTLLITIIIIITTAYTLELSNKQLELILSRADAFYETLPKTILEDAKLKVPQLIVKNGYPSETHVINTTDGFILEVFRIPHGKNGSSENRPVVLLQHGIICSSADWLVTGPEKALAYILADAGYDVWLGNARGTRYSRSHIKYHPVHDAAKFWDFSWHEIGVYDLTALIDYVLKVTNREDLFYVGHSQGTTSFLVMCSEHPEYNDKIKAMFSFAPIVFVGHLTSPIFQFLAKLEPALEVLRSMIGLYEFLPHTELLAVVSDVLCDDDAVTQVLCTNTVFAMCGFSESQMNASLLPIIMGHSPSGTSSKQFLHYAQEINSGYFRQFDYGIIANQQRYGQLMPPSYNLKNVKVPTYFFYSSNDWMSNEADVWLLSISLHNSKATYFKVEQNFNHLDYLYGIDAPKLVYSRLIEYMKEH